MRTPKQERLAKWAAEMGWSLSFGHLGVRAQRGRDSILFSNEDIAHRALVAMAEKRRVL